MAKLHKPLSNPLWTENKISRSLFSGNDKPDGHYFLMPRACVPHDRCYLIGPSAVFWISVLCVLNTGLIFLYSLIVYFAVFHNGPLHVNYEDNHGLDLSGFILINDIRNHTKHTLIKPFTRITGSFKLILINITDK